MVSVADRLKRPSEKSMAKLLDRARRKAGADVLGFSAPFSAVEWRKTLPIEVQAEVEAAIIEVYHAI